MKILITGFDAFGGEKINPSIETVKRLPDVIAGAEMIRLEIPTVRYKSLDAVEKAIEKYDPDVILSTEQIMGNLWDCDGNFVDGNTLAVYIRRLREKIEPDPSHPMRLLTVRGLGYRWEEGAP